MAENTGPSSGMHNLTTLIKRLEAATSRLEDMASAALDPHGSLGAPPAPTGTLPPPPASQANAPKPVVEDLPESVEEFDVFLAGSLKTYVDRSKELGDVVAEQALVVEKAFVLQRKMLLITTKAKKPDGASPAYMELLRPLTESIETVNNIRDKSRASPAFNQLSAVSESISVLAWVTVDTKPYKHVEDSLGSAQYYGNRVLKEFKETDPKQVAWIQSYYKIFKDLAEYVKEVFPTGIPWNAKGLQLEDVLKGESAPAPSKVAGGPPPPPPPPSGAPPPPRFDDAPKAAAPSGDGLGAVFADLNKGSDVTKGLRKVNAEQMTHKNPSLRAGATVSDQGDSSNRGKSPAPGKKPKPESMRTKKPPVKKLDGNKWFIENYDNETTPIEIEASISHSILISKCVKTTIIIKGKANAISIDNSPRLSLIVESLVSSIDVIKSSNFALQVLGVLPTILMDQVDGAQVYLGKESMGTEVFSSKCSGINLNIIDGAGEEGDYKEVALPEQIRSFIGASGKVESEIVEHAG